MRNATASELETLAMFEVTIRFKVNKARTKKVQHIVFGHSEKIAGQQALEAIQKHFSEHGSDFEIDSIEDNMYQNKKFFNWDWKQVPNDESNEAFFEKLDSQLERFGAEVVQIPFDGDAYWWFVGPRNK